MIGVIKRVRTIDTYRAFAIHIFTASGAALALIALLLAVNEQWAAMFFCLGVAVIVDALDGPIAREFKVSEVLPRWSGETLDLVVDFSTYVFVPGYAITTGGLLPHVLAVFCGIVVVVTGALYFADRDMKTRENYFQGFPAVWNVAAFYLFLLEPPSWLSALMVLVLAVLTFLPVQFVHPIRVVRWRPLNVALIALWGLFALIAVSSNLAPGAFVTLVLCVIATYFLVSGYLAERAGRV
ncbi:MAG: CDP-alcohol phosphatidyltransferase family protein [Pseudolabrys sp.]|nr:CDP-alcohol phosphatidyltransferase family protein [Pseudolabrys sp.]